MQTHVTVFQSCQQGRSSIRRSNIYPCTHVDSGGNFACTYSNSCSSCTSFDKAACLLRFPDAISLLLMYSSGMELHSYWPKYAEQPLPSTICTDGTADKSELVFLQAATMSYPLDCSAFVSCSAIIPFRHAACSSAQKKLGVASLLIYGQN